MELGRQNQKVLLADLDLDAGMIAFITKTKATYSILDAVNNLHRLDLHYWKALVSNGIPGVEIVWRRWLWLPSNSRRTTRSGTSSDLRGPITIGRWSIWAAA